MSIVANKHKGIRAAVCESTVSAKLSREHNDANILCFGARVTKWDTAAEIVKMFLTTPFSGRTALIKNSENSLTHRFINFKQTIFNFKSNLTMKNLKISDHKYSPLFRAKFTDKILNSNSSLQKIL